MKFETKITEIIPRTADVNSYRFPRPAELTYKPGQFFFVTIKQGDKELTHHFSFSSSPTEKEHFEFTKKFTDHEYSLALKAAKVGDWARIDAPYGQFTFEGEYPKNRFACRRHRNNPVCEHMQIRHRQTLRTRKLLFSMAAARKMTLHSNRNLKACKKKTRI